MKVRDARLARNGRSPVRRPRAPSTAVPDAAGAGPPLARVALTLQRGGNHAVARLLDPGPAAGLPVRSVQDRAILQRARGGRDEDRRRDRERTQQRARQRAGKRERLDDPYPFGAEASAAGAPAQTPMRPGFKDYKDRSGEFLDAMAEARAAKDASTVVFGRGSGRAEPSVTGSHADALRDYRAQQALALADYAATRQQPAAAPAGGAPAPAAPGPLPAAAAPAPAAPAPAAAAVVAAPLFDAAAAAALVAAHPPIKDFGGVNGYLGYVDRVDAAALANLGFDWGAAHVALVSAALASQQAAMQQAAAAAAGAAGAAAAARAARLQGFDAKVPATWELNDVEYRNGVREADVTGAADGTRVLDEIASAKIRSNGPKGKSVDPTIGRELHAHLSSGSWGVAFIYVQEADGTVTPYVYDIATTRGGATGNMYKWKNDGTDYNSSASHPT